MHIKVEYISGWHAVIGLIGKQKATPVLLRTRFGIHTFGLRFPIDVLILDQENRVVRLTENLRSNKIFVWAIKYNRVIELPAGFIDVNKIVLGDIIKVSLHQLPD